MVHSIRIGALEYLTADCLAGTAHCFSTRLGGVSEGKFSSMNLGMNRGDETRNVLENYRILGNAVGFSPDQTVFTRQEHTDRVRAVTRRDRGAGLLRSVDEVRDAVMTDEAGTALVCFSADCTLILLYDPVRRAIAAVHSGWRGTAMGIVQKTVQAMQKQYGCRPESIRAAIGPCIGPCCFEVGPEVPQAMREALGAAAEPAIRPADEKAFVDLKMLNRLWLERAGVTQIEISADCTKCSPDRYWSHRITGNERGSLAGIIMLPEEQEESGCTEK